MPSETPAKKPRQKMTHAPRQRPLDPARTFTEMEGEFVSRCVRGEPHGEAYALTIGAKKNWKPKTMKEAASRLLKNDAAIRKAVESAKEYITETVSKPKIAHTANDLLEMIAEAYDMAKKAKDTRSMFEAIDRMGKVQQIDGFRPEPKQSKIDLTVSRGRVADLTLDELQREEEDVHRRLLQLGLDPAAIEIDGELDSGAAAIPAPSGEPSGVH